jgi:hypothetical protein
MRRVAAALLLAASVDAAGACALDLLDAPTGAPLAHVPLPPERTFALRYTHSVSLREVESRYTVRDGSLMQTAEVFDEHGPGMSTDAGPGEWFETQRDASGTRFVLHMSRPIPRLVVRLHERPAFRLVVAGRETDLSRWNGRAIELRPDCAGGLRAPQ